MHYGEDTAPVKVETQGNEWPNGGVVFYAILFALGIPIHQVERVESAWHAADKYRDSAGFVVKLSSGEYVYAVRHVLPNEFEVRGKWSKDRPDLSGRSVLWVSPEVVDGINETLTDFEREPDYTGA